MAISPVSINNTPNLSQAVASNRPSAQREKVVSSDIPVEQVGRSLTIDSDVVDAKYQANIEYDNSTDSHSKAISQYLLTQHADQRDSISSMVGVDIYA